MHARLFLHVTASCPWCRPRALTCALASEQVTATNSQMGDHGHGGVYAGICASKGEQSGLPPPARNCPKIGALYRIIQSARTLPTCAAAPGPKSPSSKRAALSPSPQVSILHHSSLSLFLYWRASFPFYLSPVFYLLFLDTSYKQRSARQLLP